MKIRTVPLSPKLAEKIRSALTPELLKPQYRRLKDVHPMTGHCYVASEALYWLWGKKNGFEPYVVRVPGGTHWYLQGPGGWILDLTKGQFLARPPYERGHRCAFLTNKKGGGPSQRTKVVIRRVLRGY